MAELPRDPSSLTKEELKSELVANNVALPPGEQRKNVYVKLYREVLAARSRGTPDFSSDEERSERKSTPMRGRGRPPGRKATKKTDKPSEEEKIEPDVTELGNDALREELLKYGIKPGPILGSTRKVYEQRLLKIKEQQLTSMTPSVADFPIADNNKQNGNTDSRQYSDNEDPKIELTLETREPLRGKLKAQVSSRSKRPEENENTSEDAVSDPPRILEPEKSGRLQAVSKESTRVARRTPRKRVVTAGSLAFDDDADISETAPVTETILPSSNQTLANAVYSHFESRQVGNQVTESFKHTNALRSVSELTDLSRRTPKKQLLSENIIEKTFEEKRENKDILKEMFPYEMLTPTGISASCRRPIKGAAGRPLSLKDLEMEERYSSKYVSKYQPVVDVKAPKMKTGRSVPIWLKILFLVIVAVLSFLVYQAMETNEGNPFSKLLQGKQNLNEDEN
ncbi:thymopoietin isoform X5 [Pseudophryne corroboree]|uniref:thymopoietin isoform X5 n=1 Tax=Pseudophryne corroboree TaxID=495146 RepID=UPI0030816076